MTETEANRTEGEWTNCQCRAGSWHPNHDFSQSNWPSSNTHIMPTFCLHSLYQQSQIANKRWTSLIQSRPLLMTLWPCSTDLTTSPTLGLTNSTLPSTLLSMFPSPTFRDTPVASAPWEIQKNSLFTILFLSSHW